jgi:Protein of unknown function (DUF2523)
MTTLWTFLIGAIGSLAVRVVLSLGLGIVSYAALTTYVSSAISSMQSQYNSIPATTLQLANLGGIGEFLAIITAAIVARVSLLLLKRFKIN